MKPRIAAIILTKNESQMIANCLTTLQWCDEVWVVDNDSTDGTAEIAEKQGAKIFKDKAKSFAERRNQVLSRINTDWVVYVDADERVTPQLAREIMVQAETTTANALAMARQNMMYGNFFAHGGWQEHVTRVFRKTHFRGWHGEIHESPQFEGEAVLLHSPLLHFTHRNTIDGLYKTISWTPIEAELLAHAHTPPVRVTTILRKGIMEFLRRGIFQRGYQDGMAGWIEAIVQGINRMLVYIQVWERQQQPSLPEKYHAEEKRLVELWKTTKV